MLDTVVISGDDVCCSVVFDTLVGVFVFSVMLTRLDYSRALEYIIIRRYTNIVYCYYY